MYKLGVKLYHSGLVWTWIAVIVLIVDRWTKMAADQHLSYLIPLPILPFLNFTLSYNTGAAFGFLNNAAGWQNGFLGGLGVIISIAVLGWMASLPRLSYGLNIALSFVLGGALGNVWDRALYGHVIDFLSFHIGGWYFAIFNVADSAISMGAFMLCCYWLIGPRKQNG